MSLLSKIKDDPILPAPKLLHLVPVFIPDTSSYVVSVENPRKIGDKNPYVAYTVKTTRKAENSTSIVERRYSDFEWLWELLRVTHPSCVVPQIPEKTISGNFDEGLMAFRARELTRFLQRVLAHPLMSTDEAVQFFITASEADFAARRSRKESKEGFFASLKRVASTAMGAQDDPEPWFKEKADEVLGREVLLTQMLQTVQRIILQYQQLRKLIIVHVETYRSFLEYFDGASTKDAVQKFCQNLDQTKNLIDDYLCELSVTVSGNILDYIHELQSINSLIERRVPLLRAYLSASKGAASGSAEASAKCDEAQTQLSQFSNAARADIQQVCDIRNGDMERFFGAISRFTQEYYRLLSSCWGGMVSGPAADVPDTADPFANPDDGAFAAAATQTTTATTTSVYADAY